MPKQFLIIHTNGTGKRYVRDMSDTRKVARFDSHEAADMVAEAIREKGETAEIVSAEAGR